MPRIYSEILGREVEVPDRPERIVSLSPALTEILYMLGLEDRIAGVSIFCHKPPEAEEKPKVGSYYKVMYSRLEELKPDLVLVTTGAQLRVIGELVERGYTVYPIPLPVTMTGVVDQVLHLGIVTGRLGRARELAFSLMEELLSLKGALKGVKVYYEVFLGGPVSFGGHTYLADAMHLMGASTPFQEERTTWVVNPSPSTISRFDPDIILYEGSPYAKKTIEDVIKDFQERGLGSLRALKEKRIILLEPDTLAHYGPSLIKDLQRIARQVVARAR